MTNEQICLLILLTLLVILVVWDRTPPHVGLRRKLAVASWRKPSDPTIYSTCDVDVENALLFIHSVNQLIAGSNQTPFKVTLTAFCTRCVGLCMATHPQVNARLIFGKPVRRPTVGVCVLATVEGGSETTDDPDLSRVLIDEADKQTMASTALRMEKKLDRLRTRTDEEQASLHLLLSFCPQILLRPVVNFIAWITSCLGIGAKWLNLRPHPFGSLVLTNVGTFGIHQATVPLTSFCHAPSFLCLGAVRKVPRVVEVNGVETIAIRRIMTATVSFDHRLADGAVLSRLYNQFRLLVENPHKHFNPTAEAVPFPLPVNAS